MKLILCICLGCSAFFGYFSASAQLSVISLKSTEQTVSGNIFAHNPTSVLLDDGSKLPLSEIVKIIFYQNPSESLVKRLSDAGISYEISDEAPKEEVSVKPVPKGNWLSQDLEYKPKTISPKYKETKTKSNFKEARITTVDSVVYTVLINTLFSSHMKMNFIFTDGTKYSIEPKDILKYQTGVGSAKATYITAPTNEFYKVEFEGPKMSLYSAIRNTSFGTGTSTQSVKTEVSVIKKANSSEYITAHQFTFKKYVEVNMADCPAAVEEILKRDLSFKEINLAVRIYNEKCD